MKYYVVLANTRSAEEFVAYYYDEGARAFF